MENWLTHADFEQLIKEMNPQLQAGIHQDANWSKLKQEQLARKPIYDPAKTVKTKTPTLMVFENNLGFVYRRWDGAQWHTELRDVNKKSALTPEQHKLKDSIDTLLAVTDQQIKLQWYTPIDKSLNAYDPRYQLIQLGEDWMCWINGLVYAASTRRYRKERGYWEITFSTNESAVFDLETVNNCLDSVLGQKKG